MAKLYKNQEYHHFLSSIQQQIQQARVKAVIAVNYQPIQLYWKIGNEIINRQKKQQWGAKVIKQLSQI